MALTKEQFEILITEYPLNADDFKGSASLSNNLNENVFNEKENFMYLFGEVNIAKRVAAALSSKSGQHVTPGDVKPWLRHEKLEAFMEGFKNKCLGLIARRHGKEVLSAISINLFDFSVKADPVELEVISASTGRDYIIDPSAKKEKQKDEPKTELDESKEDVDEQILEELAMDYIESSAVTEIAPGLYQFSKRPYDWLIDIKSSLVGQIRIKKYPKYKTGAIPFDMYMFKKYELSIDGGFQFFCRPNHSTHIAEFFKAELNNIDKFFLTDNDVKKLDDSGIRSYLVIEKLRKKLTGHHIQSYMTGLDDILAYDESEDKFINLIYAKKLNLESLAPAVEQPTQDEWVATIKEVSADVLESKIWVVDDHVKETIGYTQTKLETFIHYGAVINMKADTEFTFVKVDSYLTAVTEIDNDKNFSDHFEWVVNELTIEKIMNEYGQSADYMTTAEIQAHSGFKDRLAKLLIQSINLKVEKNASEPKPVDLDIEAIKQEYKKKSSFLSRLLNR